MSDSKRDGTRFVDADDLAKAEQLILDGLDTSRRNDSQSNRPKSQFTLMSIFMLMFFVSLGLSAGGDWVPASTFAGIMGFLAIIAFWLMAVAYPNSSRGRLIWTGIALAYFLACVATVLRIKA